MAIGNGRLGLIAISAIVLLRLAVGWHFYSEGVKKLEPGFSSAGFLRGAKGPMAPLYTQFVASAHGFDDEVAVPRKLGSMTVEEGEANAEWRKRYRRELKIAEREGRVIPLEYPPNSSYTGWIASILASWESQRDDLKSTLGAAIDQEQETTDAEIDAIYLERRNQLVRYLANEESNIDEYRHELWRVDQAEQSPEREVAFQEDRIAEKQAETARTARSLLGDVETLEDQYREDLLNYAQLRLEEAKPQSTDAVEKIIYPDSALSTIDVVVTALVMGVGICLVLGLATPVAAALGALFLLSVMASQPPWVAGANTEYFLYQLVEVFAFFVLGATGAGRWYGLDGLLNYFYRGCCRKSDQATPQTA